MECCLLDTQHAHCTHQLPTAVPDCLRPAQDQARSRSCTWEGGSPNPTFKVGVAISCWLLGEREPLSFTVEAAGMVPQRCAHVSPLRVGLKFIINNNYCFYYKRGCEVRRGTGWGVGEGSWKVRMKSACNQNTLHICMKISKRK